MRRDGAAAYFILLAVQTVAAVTLFWVVFPLFQQIVLEAGRAQPLDPSTSLAALCAAAVMQLGYWTRYCHVAITTPIGGALLGHVLMFASRVSFFFSGALFSLIFFRHVPQLDSLPPLGQGIAKAAGVMVLLFASFCYALELERLGRAMEDEAGKAG